MTTITIHQVGYRDGRPIARSVTGSMGPVTTDPVQIAKQAWEALNRGRWRQHAKVGTPMDKAVAWLSVHHREALAVLPRWAIYARTVKDASKACCHWKAAIHYAATSFEPNPKPTEATRAFLGEPCVACAQQHALDARVAEVRAAFAADAARARRRRALQTAGLRWFEGRPPAPTGLLWTGSQPAAVTAALTAATRRRQPPPPAYYRRVVEPGDPAPPRRRTMRPRGRPS